MSKITSCALINTIFTLMLFLIPAFAGERLALVIGNSDYKNASRLANPENDAKLMAKSLRLSGFKVKMVIDANYRTFKKSMVNFGRKLRGDEIDAALFYYAGHGMQVRGENYLVPTSADITAEDEIAVEALKINDFLQVMMAANSKINIVILDSCRNNPFARSFRSSTSGLAPIRAPRGTFIAYATEPGGVAADGKGKNSPYTLALAKSMLTPDLPIERVFKTTRVDVLASTEQKQLPWESSSITGEFYFNSKQETRKTATLTHPKIIAAPMVAKKVQQDAEVEAARLLNQNLSVPDHIAANVRDLFLIQKNKFSNPDLLANFPYLVRLIIWQSNLDDISVLENMNYLELFELNGTRNVLDISPIKNLVQLKELVLYDLKISDVSPLKNLTNLTSLNLAFTEVSDISSLSGMSKLNTLKAMGAPIIDWAPVDHVHDVSSRPGDWFNKN